MKVVGESLGVGDRASFVLSWRRDDHLRTESSRECNARGDARAHLVQVAGVGEDGGTRPEDVGGGRMSVHLQRCQDETEDRNMVGTHLGGVEEEISDSTSVDVLVLVSDVGKVDAIRDF